MPNKINDIQLVNFLNKIFDRYGYDFRNYAKASITRRINYFMAKEGIEEISELTSRIIECRKLFKRLLFTISVTVTEMFRDPDVYTILKKKIIPYLKTYPRIKIWNAGCATGQEAYSIAILLYEAGLYDITQIYGTDINEKSLDIARNGIYSNEDIKISTSNYIKHGGQSSFSDYYYTQFGNSIISKKIKKNITFIKHSLSQGRSFNLFNLILCRNVLIYFNRELQTKVIDLIDGSLMPNGFLCIGTSESLEYVDKHKKFHGLDHNFNIYQKIKA